MWSFYIIQTSYKVVNLRFSLRLCHVIASRFASALQSNIFILAQVKWEWLWWPGGSRQLEIYILLFQLYFHFYVTMDSYNFYTLFVLKIIFIMPLAFPGIQSSPIVLHRLGSLVITALDSQPDGHEFNFQPPLCQVTTLGMLFTLMCLCHQAV